MEWVAADNVLFLPCRGVSDRSYPHEGGGSWSKMGLCCGWHWLLSTRKARLSLLGRGVAGYCRDELSRLRIMHAVPSKSLSSSGAIDHGLSYMYRCCVSSQQAGLSLSRAGQHKRADYKNTVLYVVERLRIKVKDAHYTMPCVKW